ncbi:BREX-2 system adenine-specific DNA-methyltransferase PglX [Nocardia sp. NPDC058499]|uniref:BREX-2 system adenine-specific DNA-methyltransferase PglX n=1 Tax=Nocardia sp. NPDC058499 TaxID=3346530 RepID=UPI00364F9404
MIDRAALLADLKKQVAAAEKDLDAQLKHPALADTRAGLHAEWARARDLKRTAATETSWLDERRTQVAVAWVLGTVFVRFCEDNHLIPDPYLTGPTPDRRELALARYDAYVETDPDPTYRGWLEHAFAELGAGQAGKLLFDPAHNALYQVPLSHDGARDLIEFWRERDEHGVLVHDFTDPLDEEGINGWDTRFLGDLYQDLSEDIRKNYALLQTPEFVEEFILDRTMTPAIREFGFEDLKMIDPTCGSGHFILGAFQRLMGLWSEKYPSKDRHEQVRSALESVHGVDINPFAVAIARFRLLVAAMAAANMRTLAETTQHEWPIKVAVGDSLIKERQLELSLGADRPGGPLIEFSYGTEDIQDYPTILQPGRYDVVVGNPPYITVKDKHLSAQYRNWYDACAGAYALSVPFAQRFFELAKQYDDSGTFGRVGQITASSFMKREFGNRLVERFFARDIELTEVIDTSGAYIPGHGTPTVILIGTTRTDPHRSPTIRTARSAQGEPHSPEIPEQGLVWSAIVDQIDQPGSKSEWVAVDDLGRQQYFAKQPWILTAGGLEMVSQLDSAGATKLGTIVEVIGRTTHTGLDDAYYMPRSSGITRGIQKNCVPVVLGDGIRDYQVAAPTSTYFPYDQHGAPRPIGATEERFLWPMRTLLRQRVDFGNRPEERGLRWFDHSMFFPKRFRSPLSIAFPFVATHNHFALDRGGKVFKQTAPAIKLPENATEEDHLRLLGLLNSSTACFWLKMVSYPKGGDPMGNSGARVSIHPWSDRYEFTGGNLSDFPVPTPQQKNIATELDQAARELDILQTGNVSDDAPSAGLLTVKRTEWDRLRERMIFLQEELDWWTYSAYELIPTELQNPPATHVPINLGERAFEIVLARQIANGEASDEWFKRHGSTAITDIPAHWPESYRQLVQRRIETIESNQAINMIERPEYKRRWATEGWDSLQNKALRSWLLDRLEARHLWFDDFDQPQLLTLSRLTDHLSRDEDFVSVAALYVPHTAVAKIVSDLIAPEHVPAVAALRYKPSGLKKRADWEHVWNLQRAEDHEPDGAKKLDIRKSIPAPPKYTSADFLRTSYWQVRGKLDVPKERFISYATTNTPTPDLYGWAGWDHREQAFALATHLTNAAPPTEVITPLLAAMLELQPWLDQWHTEVDPAYGLSPAAFLASHRRTIQGEHNLTDDYLRAWRPPADSRGGRGGRRKVDTSATS